MRRMRGDDQARGVEVPRRRAAPRRCVDARQEVRACDRCVCELLPTFRAVFTSPTRRDATAAAEVEETKEQACL